MSGLGGECQLYVCVYQCISRIGVARIYSVLIFLAAKHKLRFIQDF